MIFKFPDLKLLRLALESRVIPPTVSGSETLVAFDETGGCFVEVNEFLPRSTSNELKRLGVSSVRSFNSLNKQSVSCWAEILPLEPDPHSINHLDQLPVLFEVNDGAEFARLATEILRLGNDRQSYRWLEEEQNGSRSLLRVVGPPYYSLLRAIDGTRGSNSTIAYRESAENSRVWVELGYSHPLQRQIRPPIGKLLLLRPPRQWSLLEEAPFRDLYEGVEFQVPDRVIHWKDTSLPERIAVRLSLKQGGATTGARLWVLNENPLEELNRFVQNSPDELLQRLSFAVGESRGKQVIVLRIRQLDNQPLHLSLSKATAYLPFINLQNLFLPVGTLLHPPLRRDQVRKLLANDINSIVWLQPHGDGRFTPMSLPENVFRPLWDWIDYVLDHDQESLNAWVQAMQFDFEGFICDDETGTKPKKPPVGDTRIKPSRERERLVEESLRRAQPKSSSTESGEAESLSTLEPFTSISPLQLSQVLKEVRALEEQFITLEGGLDHPQRQQMWPIMAGLYAQLDSAESQDAGICWINAMWESDAEATRNWSWQWFLSEARSVPARQNTSTARPRAWVGKVTQHGATSPEISGEDLDRLLALEEPATADLRALAAYLVYWAGQPNPSAELLQRLGPISRFLEKYEKVLPVRGVWLAWLHLTLLARGDVLALARARDRLLERLYHNGLRPEQDLPGFLRFAGQPTSQRFRAVRQWLVELATLAQEWVRRHSGQQPKSAQTPAYVDLLFAFGLAKLGENEAARDLCKRAKSVLQDKDEVHKFLLKAFEYRIQQALDGKPHSGSLPDECAAEMGKIERLNRYVVDRLRNQSRILEPDEQINPYRFWVLKVSDFEKALAELTDLTNRQELVRRIDALLAEVSKDSKGIEPRARVVRAGLEVAPRVGEEFARRMLDLAVPIYDQLPEITDQPGLTDHALFLEKALFVAGHFGRIDTVHLLVNRFQKMLRSAKVVQDQEEIDRVAVSCLRGLRKLGMRDEIDQILRQMADLILEGREIKSIDFSSYPSNQGPAALRTLLHVAEGWYYFGRDSQAEQILQTARQILLANNQKSPRDQTRLACAYARAVGQAPVEVAQKRLEELFRSLQGIEDRYTTNNHFSVSHLDVVEKVVLAVVSDDFTMGTQARRWLDEDEYLVRRRIHRDLRQLLENH